MNLNALLPEIALFLVVFGAAIVFSDRFFSWMNVHWWDKGIEEDKNSWSPEGRRLFNRYGRGLGLLVGGLILLAGVFGLLR